MPKYNMSGRKFSQWKCFLVFSLLGSYVFVYLFQAAISYLIYTTGICWAGTSRMGK